MKTQTEKQHLNYFCNKIKDRSTGSKGNIKATRYFENILKKYNWQIQKNQLVAMDWKTKGAE